MKRVFVSQRVDDVESRNERRDALDQRFTVMLNQIDCICMPLPNDVQVIRAVWNQSAPDAVILSGGNDPVVYGGDSPERDAADNALIDLCVVYKTPLLGICRGMQSIVLHFGGSLKKTQGHVGARHGLQGVFNQNVNSYHVFAPCVLPDSLEVLSFSDDGCIEHISHRDLQIHGIMWHPEREYPMCKIQLGHVKEMLYL